MEPVGEVAALKGAGPSAIVRRGSRWLRAGRSGGDVERGERSAPAASPHDVERVAASGSCARCGRALDLASAKVDGRWYGNEICATGAPCPLDRRPPAVPEPWLYSRPRRHLRRRLPKELKASTAR